VVNALDTLLLHGTMNPQMRTSIVTAMNAINDANVTTRNQKRARMAVYLVASSSQYDIQR
jgi:acyl transferase domain-containing protein